MTPNAKPRPKLRRRQLSWRVRRKLGLTQEQFVERYCISIGTIRDCERQTTDLDPVDLALLKAVAANPEEVAKAQKTEGA